MLRGLDAASAKLVAHHPQVKMRTITLDGDVYDPGKLLHPFPLISILFMGM